MTVTNTKSYNEYVSTGTETSWAFTFDAQEVGQIVVLEIDENNVETDVTASATIDIVAQTVTYGPIAAGRKLRIERRTTATQNVDLESQGPILPQVLENALDKLTYIAQESANTVADMRNTVVQDIKYAGDWTSGTYYKENQAVTLYDSLYIAKVGHTADASNAPTDGASNATWAIAAKKGHTPVWKGAWSSGASYATLDMYEHNGASYVCKQTHVASSATEPGIGTDWAVYQDRMVISAPSDGSITTAKIADGAVTPAKIDSTQDYTFNTSIIESTWPQVILRDTDSNTHAHFLTNAGVTYIRAGAAGAGGTLSSGEFRIEGWGGENVGLVRLRRNGALHEIWADDNFAARIAALTANTAPAGTESVACDDGQKVTLQAIADLAGAKFISGWLSFSSFTGGASYVAHGLSASAVDTAKAVIMQLRCDVANNGYSIGDYVFVHPAGPANSTMIDAVLDYINAGFTAYSTGGICYIANKAAGGAGVWVSSTNTDWSFRIIVL